MGNVVSLAGVYATGQAATLPLRTEPSLPDTRVYGLSRRSAPLPADVEAVSADLLDRDNVQRKLGTIRSIIHIAFGACISKPTTTERSEVNVAILEKRKGTRKGTGRNAASGQS